jgi:hypothetical protein
MMHIRKIFSTYVMNDNVICLGYQSYTITAPLLASPSTMNSPTKMTSTKVALKGCFSLTARQLAQE